MMISDKWLFLGNCFIVVGLIVGIIAVALNHYGLFLMVAATMFAAMICFLFSAEGKKSRY